MLPHHNCGDRLQWEMVGKVIDTELSWEGKTISKTTIQILDFLKPNKGLLIQTHNEVKDGIVYLFICLRGVSGCDTIETNSFKIKPWICFYVKTGYENRRLKLSLRGCVKERRFLDTIEEF